MKNFILLCLAIFTVASCATDPFATTERRTRNGRVYYVNHHSAERLHRHKIKRRSVSADVTAGNDNTAKSRSSIEIVSPIEPIAAVQDGGLIASTQKSLPVISSAHLSLSGKTTKVPHTRYITPDTTKKVTARNEGPPVDTRRRIEGFSIAGFITSIVALFIAGIPLGIFSIILGTVGMIRISSAPKKRMGRGFAIAALIIGCVAIIGAIIVLSYL